MLVIGALLTAGGCVSTPDDAREPTAQDALAVLRTIRDSGEVLRELRDDGAFWQRSGEDPLTPDERAWLLPLFATFIDHDVAFMSYRELFLSRWTKTKDPKIQVYGLAVGLGAHAAQTRARVGLLQLVRRNEAIHAALNEGSPEHGVATGHLDRMMIELASPDTLWRLEIGLEALARRRERLAEKAQNLQGVDRDKLWQALKHKRQAILSGTKLPADLQARIDSVSVDAVFVALVDDCEKLAMEVGAALTTISGKLLKRTIAAMIGTELNNVLAPITKDIALWLGDTRLRTSGRHLIDAALLDKIQPTLQPGDVVVERRNWYLSNLGLPGFWPHAAFYIGSPVELAEHFDNDAGVVKRFGGPLSVHLASAYPIAWAAFQADHGDGPMRIIEAVSEGVVFASLHHSCLADYAAFMRPRRSKLERAVAIEQAYSHWNKPYDFDFDFQTITTLVCSELVYSSFQLPAADGVGLRFDLERVVGRLTLPPNSIVQQFDRDFGTPAQQLDFVAFLDGNEAVQTATEADVATFRASWKRSKWDLSQQ